MSDRRPTMQDEADAQLKWIRENMSEAPAASKQVWITGYASDPTNRWWSEKPISRGLEYVSADTVKAQIDAAVKAERERCAQVAEQRIGVCDALRQASCWDDNCELIAKTAEVEAGIIAAAIRKEEQP